MNYSLETKIQKAISNNRLNINKLGERNWHNLFIRITLLCWNFNLHDGYKIEVYTEKYGSHLGTVII